MIPYFQYNAIIVGPVTLQVWGLMVALGILAAAFLSKRLAQKHFLSAEVILDMALWALVSAFIFARFFHVVFYAPGYYLANPWEIPALWHGGASSLGGFFGAGLAIWVFAKRRKFTWAELLPYFDIAALSLWLGWGIGRIGCFLIHDHPGTLSHFVLAVRFPDGARHDLGLYESLLGFFLFGLFLLIGPQLMRRRAGLVAYFSTLLYAAARFGLDFLRESPGVLGGDVRYFAFTPAQWGMLGYILTLTLLLIFDRVKRQPSK